jgi:hypothetical protein
MCTIQVQFAPTTVGALTGSLSIYDNAAGSPQVVSLSGTGVWPVGFNPTSFTFSNTAVGYSSAAKQLTLTNNQSVPVSLGTSFAGNNPADFAIVSGGTCSGSLAAGSSCTIMLAFKPTSTGTRSATLIVTDSPDSYSPHSIVLSGTGLVQVSVAPTSLSFGQISVGSTSSAKTVTVTNNQPVTMSLSANLSGTNKGDFAITSASTCSSSLAAASKCSYSVTFSPTKTGNRSATLVVNGSPDPNSPHDVSLSGNGH